MADNVIGDLFVRLKVDTSGIKQGLNNAKETINQSTNNMKQQFSGVGQSIKQGISGPLDGLKQKISDTTADIQGKLEGMGMSAGTAKVATVGAFAAIGVAAIAMAKKVVQQIWNAMNALAELAWEAQDVRDMFNSVFSSTAQESNKWASDLARSYQVAETPLRQAMADLGLLFKSTGNTGAQANKMAQDFTKLAYDISAAYAGISLEEAQQALEGVAKGNVRGLKNLGIVMTDLDIQNYAVAKGFAQQGQTLTAAQKQMALYGVTMEKLGNIEGAYGESSKTFENVTNAKNAAVLGLKETLGKLLMPVVNAINVAITYLAKAVTWLVDKFRIVAEVVWSFWAGVFEPVFSLIHGVLVQVWDALKGFFDWLVNGVKSAVNFIAGLFGKGPIFDMSPAKQGAEEAIEVIEEVGATATDTEQVIQEAMAGLAGFDKLTTLSTPTEDSSQLDMAEDLLGVIKDTDNAADDVGKTMADWAKKIGGMLSPINLIKSLIDLDWGGLWNGFKEAAGDAWNGVKDFAGGIWGGITSTAGNMWAKIRGLGESAWSGISSFAGGIWQGISDFAGTIWGGIKAVGEGVWNAIMNVATTLWNTLKGVVDAVFGFWKNLGESIWEAFGKAFDFIWGGIQAVYNATIKPIIDSVMWLVDKIGGVGDFMGDMWSGFKQTVGLEERPSDEATVNTPQEQQPVEVNVNAAIELDGVTVGRLTAKHVTNEQERSAGGVPVGR